MVLYFISKAFTIRMASNKRESRQLFEISSPQDVWFHVDKLASAHVYVSLQPGEALKDIPEAVVEDCCQLVKSYSIQDNENGVDINYSFASNLERAGMLATGHVEFRDQTAVRCVRWVKQKGRILNRLEKTRKDIPLPDTPQRQQGDGKNAGVAQEDGEAPGKGSKGVVAAVGWYRQGLNYEEAGNNMGIGKQKQKKGEKKEGKERHTVSNYVLQYLADDKIHQEDKDELEPLHKINRRKLNAEKKKPNVKKKKNQPAHRSEAEMEALKNYSLNVEFEDDYWRETKQNADRSQQEEFVESADDLLAHGERIRPLINLKGPEITPLPRHKRPTAKSRAVSFAPTPGDFVTPGKPSNKRTLSRRRTTRFSSTPAGPMASTPFTTEHKNRSLYTADMSPIVSASKQQSTRKNSRQQSGRQNEVPVPKNVAKDIHVASEDDWEDTSKAERSEKNTEPTPASERQFSGMTRPTIVVEKTSVLFGLPGVSAENYTASVDSRKRASLGSKAKPKRTASRKKRSTVVAGSDAVVHDISPIAADNTPRYIDVEKDVAPPRESGASEPITGDGKAVTEPSFGIFKKPLSPETPAADKTDQSEVVVARASLRISRLNKSAKLDSTPVPAPEESNSRRSSDLNDVVIASVSKIIPLRRSRRTVQPARTLQRTAVSPTPTTGTNGIPTPVTPISSVHSMTSDGQHRIQRESLVPAFFSPAVVRMSQDGRASFIHMENDHSRASLRRSIVQGARKSPLNLLLEIATPSRVIETGHLLDGEGFTNLIKIGEGSFADVFSAMRNGEEVVLKIVPVDGTYLDGQPQTSLEDIVSESIISIELSRMLVDGSDMWLAPVFAKTHFIKVAQGSYPDEFGQRHDSFSRNNSANCLNQHPVMYPRDQRFVIIGLNNGGQDLETFPLANHQQARSVFMQVALGLAVAEEALEFEHRDLHISNILIRLTTDENIVFRRNDRRYVVPSCGIYVTIIDWTLSRIRRKNRVIYKDLSTDEQIFTGRGDIQYDVYRKMRRANKNDWSTFRPDTNVMWLEYLQNKLLKEKTISPGDTLDKKAKKELEMLKPTWKCQSAGELVESAKMFVDLPE